MEVVGRGRVSQTVEPRTLIHEAPLVATSDARQPKSHGI